MKINEVIYIYPKDRYEPCISDFEKGFFAVVDGFHEGDEDLSYHGSPFYEQFVDCHNCITLEQGSYGSQAYEWIYVKDYMIRLKELLMKIKMMLY